MSTLQEMIARARFLLSSAPKRMELFRLIDGKRSTKDIAREVGRSLAAIGNDIAPLRDMELIKEKTDNAGNPRSREGASIYKKHPLLRHVPLSMFMEVANTAVISKGTIATNSPGSRASFPATPSEPEILDIASKGETHIYEFKGPGTATEKITKEIAAFIHTKHGGIIFYGIEDDGSIIGSDKSAQDMDQALHNSVQNTISPPPNIHISAVKVLGATVIVISIRAWDRRTIFQYTKDNRYYIRKGTNVFALQASEISRLSRGEYVDE